MSPYELLEKVRNLITNIEATPLCSVENQADVLYHLRQAREILRAAHDTQEAA